MNTMNVLSDEKISFVNRVLGGDFFLFYDRLNSKIIKNNPSVCFHVKSPNSYFALDIFYEVPKEYRKGMIYEAFYDKEIYNLTCSPYIKFSVKESWHEQIEPEYKILDVVEDFLKPFFAIYCKKISNLMELYVNDYYLTSLLTERDHDTVRKYFANSKQDYLNSFNFIRGESYSDFMKEEIRNAIVNKKFKSKILKFLEFVLVEPNFSDLIELIFKEDEHLYAYCVEGAIALEE